MLTTTDVGNATQSRGVLDHQVLRIGGAQDTEAFCQLVRGWGAVEGWRGACVRRWGPLHKPFALHQNTHQRCFLIRM